MHTWRKESRAGVDVLGVVGIFLPWTDSLIAAVLLRRSLNPKRLSLYGDLWSYFFVLLTRYFSLANARLGDLSKLVQGESGAVADSNQSDST